VNFSFGSFHIYTKVTTVCIIAVQTTLSLHVATQTASLLLVSVLNHLNEIVFPPVYRHPLSEPFLTPRKLNNISALMGTSFTLVTVPSSVWGRRELLQSSFTNLSA